MRILVTGATGFLGNNIVRALQNQGHEISVTLRASSRRSTLDGLNVEPVLVDLSQPTDIGLAVKDVDVVIHAAAMIHLGWGELELSRKVNVEATAKLAESCRRNKVRLIHVSSVDALGAGSESEVGDETKLDPPKPACSYVVSKREAESAVILEVANGLDAVIVNPGFMVGPFDWKPSSGAMMLGLYKSPVVFFAPAGGCSVVDVRDVADGVISAIEHGRTGHRYILGGQNMSYMELWTLMAKVMNKRRPKRPLPNWLASMVGRLGDLTGKVVGREQAVNSAALKMGQMFHYYSSAKAERELGYRIGSVEDALKDSWDWFKLKEMV